MNNSDNENQGQGKPGIRIVDRRRFDSDGEEKAEVEVNETVISKADKSKADTATNKEFKSSNSDPYQNAKATENADFTMHEPEHLSDGLHDESEISFGSFVLSLATQALMQLGQLKAPDGMSIPVDADAAQQTIDILAMLQTKTKGNLDVKEDGLLRDALQSLRVAFLKNR